MDEKLFKFRGDNINAGQYAFPFTFRIPSEGLPSSFYYKNKNGERFSVKYTIEAYFNLGE